MLAPLMIVAMAAGLAPAEAPIAYPGMPRLDSSCLADYDRYLERQSPEGDGSVDVPVLVVHGWASSSESFDMPVDSNGWGVATSVAKSADASILQRLVAIPRASVFTFNFEKFAARWVESNEQGTAMAGVIDCLHRASGHPVNIVAHSMGGLVVRQALKETPDREAKVGQVVTIGTPNTGSDTAGLGHDAVEAIGNAILRNTPIAYPFFVAAKAKLGICVEQVNDEGLGSRCLAAPAIEGFFADGGAALRTGSDEIERLRDWPASVDVHAIAGDYALTVDAQLGSSRSPATLVSLGDPMVSVDSALAGADTTFVQTCDVTYTPAFDVLSAITRTAEAAIALSPNSLPACSHNGLLSNLLVVNNVVGTITTAVEARPTAALLDLSGYQITQHALEPVKPTSDLMTIETMATDRQSIIGGAVATFADVEFSTAAMADCRGGWCSTLPADVTGEQPRLFVNYRTEEGTSNFDVVDGFFLLYPSDGTESLLPKTDRGIGAKSTLDEVKAAYSDMFTWDWTAQAGENPSPFDGRSHSHGLSVLAGECDLDPLMFLFDDDDVLTAIATGTAWDSCG
jgi:triacylglycerol lipase